MQINSMTGGVTLGDTSGPHYDVIRVPRLEVTELFADASRRMIETPGWEWRRNDRGSTPQGWNSLSGAVRVSRSQAYAKGGKARSNNE